MSNVSLAELMATVSKKATVLMVSGKDGRYNVVVLGDNVHEVVIALAERGNAVSFFQFDIVG